MNTLSALGILARGTGIVLICVVMGCEQNSAPMEGLSGPGADKSVTTEVTIALNWYPEAEHGGYYAALVHGYYADEGLKVTLRPGGPKVPVLADVTLGTVPFAVDNADKLLLSRVQNGDTVAVMAPIQNSPRCIMVHKSSGLTRLEDLKDKRPFTLAVNAGQPFFQFLKKHVDLTDVQIVPYAGPRPFLQLQDFGQQAYSFSEPFVAEQNGSDPLCLMVSDLGFNAYTSLLITRSELINKQPEVVEKVVRASIKGWKKYLDDPDVTNKHIHDENAEMSLEALKFGIDALKPLCLVEGSKLGEMTTERWKTLSSQMSDSGSIEKPLQIEDAFTTKFLH